MTLKEYRVSERGDEELLGLLKVCFMIFVSVIPVRDDVSLLFVRCASILHIFKMSRH